MPGGPHWDSSGGMLRRASDHTVPDLFDLVRRACLPAIWNQGVKLARTPSVSFEHRDDHRIVARVSSPGHAIAPTVMLYLDDSEWACDCGGAADPCAHVAAAAIAAHRDDPVPAASQAAPAPRAWLSYRFRRPQPGALALDRFLVDEHGRAERLTRPLTTSISSHSLPVGFNPTHDDLDVDRILSAQPRPTLPLSRIGTLLAALASARDVRFDDRPIRASSDPVLPRAGVRNDGEDAVLLAIEQESELELVAPGVAIVSSTLRPLGLTELTGLRLERLPLLRRFEKRELGELAGKVLPELATQLDVRIETDRLPRSVSALAPRIQFDFQAGHEPGSTLRDLWVLPLVVYGDPPIARVEGATLVPLGDGIPPRDESAERRLAAELRDELDLAPGRRVRFSGLDAARFTERLRAFQNRRNEDLPRDWTRAGALVPDLTIDDGRATVRFRVDRSTADGVPVTADAALVVAAWREGLNLVPLLDGGWAPLPADWLARWGATIADLLATSSDSDAPTPVPLLAELCAALDQPPPVELERLRPLFSDFSELPRAELPVDLRAELRSYQRTGVDWLCFLREAELGGVLADDMGLGKTLQALCSVRGRTLIVAPRSVIHNWAAEIARFRPALKLSIYHGPNRELDPSADVTLTTYAVLRLDIERLAAERWSTAILDEAQTIKNAESQVARAAYRLRAPFRLSLTGTPIENRLEELWSQMHFANPGLLGGRRDFSDRVAAGIANGNAEAAERLRARIRPFVLRRLKAEVAPELPPKTESILYVELDENERAAYDAVHAATRDRVMEELGAGRVLAALEALLRLRQAACHRALLPGQEAESSAKVERLLECLEEIAAEGRRALVFSQWTGLLDLVEPGLERLSIRFGRLDGSTRDRASVVGEFQSEDGPPVLLASLKAGGTGLNLTAADHVFLLDPWWNPAAEDQAADRAHRIGQTRPVFVYRLVAKNTVEERILALQERKRELVDLALEGAARAITREDLMSLFD